VEGLEDRAVPAFVPVGTFPTGAHPVAIVAGELTGDTNVDVVTANAESDNVSVLPGNGLGTFGPAATFPVQTFGRPSAVAVANFRGDSRPDLVTPTFLPHSVSVLLGDGPGPFGASADFLPPPQPVAVGVGLFTPDSLPDVITANASGSVSVLLGNG